MTHQLNESRGTPMIFRLSEKLRSRIKLGPLTARPILENPFADWSARTFIANRTHYILLTNTRSLYSTVHSAKGVTNPDRLIGRSLDALREFMAHDGLSALYQTRVAPEFAVVDFAKAIDRSVIGSMNDLVYLATVWLTETQMPPLDVALKLNETPMSSLRYNNPREAFKAMSLPNAPGKPGLR